MRPTTLTLYIEAIIRMQKRLAAMADQESLEWKRLNEAIQVAGKVLKALREDQLTRAAANLVALQGVQSKVIRHGAPDADISACLAWGHQHLSETYAEAGEVQLGEAA